MKAKLNTVYEMQIRKAEFIRAKRPHLRDMFRFYIRIWLSQQPRYYIDTIKDFYDGGSAAKYLNRFVENATGEKCGEIGVSEMIGRSFYGMITSKFAYAEGSRVLYQNIEAIAPINGDDDNETTVAK